MLSLNISTARSGAPEPGSTGHLGRYQEEGIGGGLQKRRTRKEESPFALLEASVVNHAKKN